MKCVLLLERAVHFKKNGILILLVCLISFGCNSKRISQYPNQEPLLIDKDQTPFSKMPEEYYSGILWDFFDQNFLRPMTDFFLVKTSREAINVNSLDEVPNSSWFTNRIGTGKKMTPQEAALGACESKDVNIISPWYVVSGKPDGANPGFMIKDSAGKRFLLKFDGLDQPERATAADVIGSKIYYAAGYFAPCNKVVYFDPKILVISPKAYKKNALGNRVAMTQKDINKAMSNTKPLPNGLIRASISEFLPGIPIGPWKYQEKREDDYNDVVDHEHRRELRGGKVIAAWLNHFDTREQNSLAIWVKDKNSNNGHVDHYYLDFGDCFGSLWPWDGISRRHGNSYYIDPAHITEDLFTLGLKERPWHKRVYGRAGVPLGYYDIDHFEPDQWVAGYRNPAFREATENDSAWITRIIANFTDEHIDAMVDEGKIQNKFVDKELRRVIKGRRDKILFRWLKTLSPLTNGIIKNKLICFEDMAVYSGIVDPSTRAYDAFIWSGPKEVYLGKFDVESNGALNICVNIESLVRQNSTDYYVMEIVATNTGSTVKGELIKPNRPPLRVHFYINSSSDIKIVALERDDEINFDLPLATYSNFLKNNHYYNEGDPDMIFGD